ncbi:MAG: cysteine desulfurase [Thermoguttaceae bacterium]|nr:cysteine desulfurase [Thermoguttaceae bacterium]MDW8077536.1 cysteine desulfurase family protein [Thermoguttaceae bacterium]
MDVINLDHNATTSVRAEVIEAMSAYMRLGYGNPASAHRLGAKARQVLEDCRRAIADILGASLSNFPPDRVIFTSGGTEANNLAILGIARAMAEQAEETVLGRGHQIVISAMEHASVLEAAEHLLECGWRLDTVGATSGGVLRLDQLESFLTPQTRLVSVMLANHETGVIQPVREVVDICAKRGIPVHTDAVQAVGKMPVNFQELGVAAMSIAAHKFHGPPGIGALICRGDLPLKPIHFGGHQQDGFRPGTEPVALVVGMRTALELWQKEAAEAAAKLHALRRRFEAGLKQALPEIVIHGEDAPRLPHTSNIAFPGLEAQLLFVALDSVGVACSIGSACASGAAEPSPTLRAMGLPKELVNSSLRFSLGTTNTEAEIDEAVRRIVAMVKRLRRK